jgi:hypothetical protein
VNEGTCSSCKGFVGLIANIVHETQHLSQSYAPYRQLEIDATQKTVDILQKVKETRCEKIGRSKYCKSKAECERALDAEIKAEEEVNKAMKKQRRG